MFTPPAHRLILCASLALIPAALAHQPAAQPAKPVAQPGTKLLKAGDPAPAFKVAKWIKGDEVKTLEKGRVYVIDFWATFATTCKMTMPHLTELAKKYKGKEVTFIGVAIWEETKDKDGDRDPLPPIENFVKAMGAGADYPMAYAGPQGEMEITWMRSAAKPGVPTTFLIDKEGRIAWIGSPLQVDEPLAKLMGGEFDLAAERERAQAQADKDAKLRAIRDRLVNALQGGRAREVLDICREGVLFDPKAFQSIPGECFRRVIVNMNEPDLAYAYAQEFFDGPGTKFALAYDMNTMAWVTLDDPAIKKRDLDLAMKLATKAVELTQSKDASIIDTLARAYWEKGDAAKAVALSEQAVELAKKTPGLPKQVADDINSALEKYRKGKN